MKKQKKKSKEEKNPIKKFWNFIWYDDSLLSYILNLLVAFIFIKFIFFPSVGFILNNDYPVVAIVSGSMQHKIVEHRICDKYVLKTTTENLNFDSWWNYCGEYYEKSFNLTKKDLNEFEYSNGLNIGDVMVLYGKNPKDIEVGEVLIFEPQNKIFFKNFGPVIHRVVKKWKDENGKWHFQTKGDFNPKSGKNFEDNIIEDKVIGVPILRVPYLGYLKLILYKGYLFILNK